MDGEWRVSLIFPGHPGMRKKPPCPPGIRDALRARLPDDVVISAGKTAVFLYAGAEDAAAQAARVAQEVLAEQGRYADSQLGRWDPASRVWRDANGEPSDQPGEPSSLGRRGKAIAKAIGNLADVAFTSWP